MKVRYNPVVGILMLVLGGVCEFLGLWLLALGEVNPAAYVGIVPIVLGVLYLARPYFWVYWTSIAMPAPIGPMKRQFPFRTLEVEGNKLFAVHDDGTRKKVPVARWLAHSADWQAIAGGVRG